MSLIVLYDAHNYFVFLQKREPNLNPLILEMGKQYELVLKDSIKWTSILAIILAVLASLYIAKRITAPLVKMKHIADTMKQGNLDARILVQGNDEIAALGTSLNHLAEQLQTEEMLRKNLTSDIAHELRTPLTTLRTYMEAIEDKIWEPTPERIHSCYEEIERLIHLVSDLEQLSFVESPEFSLHKSEEELNDIIQQGVETVRPSYKQKGVQLIFQPSSRVFLHVDRQRIIQILINLLTNALKFTPTSGKVTVCTKDEEEFSTITVCDTGIGIAEEDIPLLFERFYRVDKSRNRTTGGGGIGLTIVKRLTESHGGTVKINSELGKGTCVTVRIKKALK